MFKNIGLNELNKVKLMNVFELVKFKPVKVSETENGEFPLYGASMFDEPVKYINKFNIKTDKNEYYIQINKNGSCGYCFLRTGKFSLTSDTTLLKLKAEYETIINYFRCIFSSASFTFSSL